MLRAPGLHWVAGGHVYDHRTGAFRRLDVGVRGERVAELAPPGSTSTVPGAEVVDARGLWLLPGLIDCHVHLVMRGEDPDPSANAARPDPEVAAYAARAAERTLAAGVTTVRDLGGWNYLEMELREAVERGDRPGPRLVLAGRLLSAPTPAARYYPGMYEVVRGARAVAEAARRQLDRGADLVKVMATGAMLSPEEEDAGEVQLGEGEIRAAVEAAAARGAYVAAHAHARDGIVAAVEAGVRSIEHGTYADESVLRRMAERGVFLVATLSPSVAVLEDREFLESMPTHIRRRLEESHATHVETVRTAHRLGVPLATGTDAGTPGNHHGANARECAALVEQAGLDPEESLRASTLDAARLLGRDADLGSIEEGKLADLIGCHRDPRADLRELGRVALVVKGGVVVRSGDPS